MTVIIGDLRLHTVILYFHIFEHFMTHCAPQSVVGYLCKHCPIFGFSCLIHCDY